MTITGDSGAWDQLGTRLKQRRAAMGFRRRKAFTDATGIDYRLIYDIEEARRVNFGTTTLTAIAIAYGLMPGAIEDFLEGGELKPAPPAAIPVPAEPGQQPLAPVTAGPPLLRRERLAYDQDGAEGLHPYLMGVRRDLYAAIGLLGSFPADAGLRGGPDLPAPWELPEVPAVLEARPGAAVFDAPHEARFWDTPQMTLREKEHNLAANRKMIADFTAGDGRERHVTSRG